MNIKLYGTRGSLPAPLKNQDYKNKIMEILESFVDRAEFSKDTIPDFFQSLPDYLKFTAGGDTTCVTVTSNAGNTYVVDCGTGGRTLGDELLKTELGKGKGELNIFITHTHWDHIQGFPFFKPMYIPGNLLNFYSPFKDLEERLVLQQQKEFFPMPFHGTASQKNFHYLEENEEIRFSDGLVVDFHPLKHPGGSYAYRFRENGKTFIFATDAEFTGEDMPEIKNKSKFFGNADLLVIDSQYTLDESFAKFDWGHTSYTMAVNCATIWEVKNLVLTHHEPAYNDKKVFDILEEAIEHKKNLGGSKLNIHLAREGLQFHI